jgi:hypothetical protein
MSFKTPNSSFQNNKGPGKFPASHPSGHAFSNLDIENLDRLDESQLNELSVEEKCGLLLKYIKGLKINKSLDFVENLLR